MSSFVVFFQGIARNWVKSLRKCDEIDGIAQRLWKSQRNYWKSLRKCENHSDLAESQRFWVLYTRAKLNLGIMSLEWIKLFRCSLVEDNFNVVTLFLILSRDLSIATWPNLISEALNQPLSLYHEPRVARTMDRPLGFFQFQTPAVACRSHPVRGKVGFTPLRGRGLAA